MASSATRKLYFDHPEIFDRIRLPNIEREVNFIDSILRSHDGMSRILDVGCGTGRHIEQLRLRGYHCVGAEPNEAMRAYAAASSGCEVIPNVMDELPTTQRYDALLCLCTVFSYNLSNKDIVRTLLRFRQVLRPRGVVIIDTINAMSFVDDTREFKKIIVEREPYSTFDLISQVHHRIQLKRQLLHETRKFLCKSTGKVLHKDRSSYRLFFPQEITYILETTGYHRPRIFSDFCTDARRPLTGWRMVVVATTK